MVNMELKDDTGRYIKKKHVSLIKYAGIYFLAALVLFIIVVLLGINNVIIYNSYKKIQHDYFNMSESVNNAISEKEDTIREKDKLMEENSLLQERYTKLQEQNLELAKQIQVIKRQNEELLSINKELTDDNISLQNTVKMAASVGIKPQNYLEFDGISSRGEIERGRYLGKFLGTAYTPSKEECGNDKGITRSGKPILPGVSIAIDNDYWPFGTVFYIKGLGYAIAMDTGSAIKGKYRFDFSVLDKKFAQALGSRNWDVYLVKMGNGYVESTNFQ